MSNRLDQEREKKLQPKRIQYAIEQIEKLGHKITFIGTTRIDFLFNGNTIQFYPYSGWHTGKGITDGRGIENLLKQIK